MAKKKLKIAVLFGGKSAEHEVSLRSAENVINALNKNKYEVILIGINKAGQWILGDKGGKLLDKTNPKLYKLNTVNSDSVALVPQGSGAISNLSNVNSKNYIDVIFPVLHGPFGEDGTVQGMFKLANIPFVGASVLGSAVGMNKDTMKRLLRDADIPICKFITLKHGEKISFKKAKKKLGIPFFIKPANMGSSVGINKVKNKKDFDKAIEEAFKFDTKILIEEFINGREIECSVLGNENPIASVPGEVIVNDEFYSYNTKYIDENGATLEIPANLSQKTIKKIQQLSVKTFKVLNCEGFGRVDGFLTKNGKFYISEINTIPGFTSISMYPKLWEANGLPLPKLLDKLISLAIERFKREQKLKTSI
ncbi:D-alanine--D-alanine ligase A [Candidatus Nomurabacteria bacterium RIFCSPHIGHO2_02_FULL_37_13]|uniref:D-alanine--D-alanine ligase n=1 Tax=Candidatus Nomurabacteria bacterium RIFCSPHIGHO2_02_FULL_37_13 TaxID=1801750 RepID=A0A1F6W7H3_9BACT|nr:MAG: D-alanine--D-alanine ligase A [Candidatus Nomurabacteria bacterium RIFCSPHIGHO2_01_FULL_36_23]OGI77625.1 MAG: D-alanine--D-alanine ligase A [Candidatus Nomurabacteria bacterium RIFCSPHIGHO2_02_FULL_37_13]OGI88285.1 MAG: D-alanine--D-alanine ligase A [Candidatus Nomurabacteria bacterium RIFCSPLOWO2_01_FULL_37_25]